MALSREILPFVDYGSVVKDRSNRMAGWRVVQRGRLGVIQAS